MLATNSTRVLVLVSTMPRQTNPSAPASHSAVQVPSALTAGEDMVGEVPVLGDHLPRAATTFPGAAEVVDTEDMVAATTTDEAIPTLRRRAKTQRDTSSTWTSPLIL